MPALYLHLKSKFKQEGLSEKAAEKKAARIFNARRPPGASPMTRNYEKTAKHYEEDKK
jgi:hypothetical protein